MSKVRHLRQDELDDIRHRYDTGESLEEIARAHGMSRAVLTRRILTLGWTRKLSEARRNTAREQNIAPDTTELFEQAPGSGTSALSRKVENAVRRELAGIEQNLGAKGDPADAERNARVLASLVKSLVELGRLEASRREDGNAKEGSGGAHAEQSGERPPRNLAQLREELAARLDRIQADRDARQSS
ncbi:MAG: hypothetical protein AB7F96_02705 [Beijerinckiaceae bacterium]